MSDNVKDELVRILDDPSHLERGDNLKAIGKAAADTFMWSDSMECYRWNHERIGFAVLAHLAERGMVVLGPDGEPLDVRPALRSCGREAKNWGEVHDFFTEEEIPPPLADACSAAAEVEL